MSKTSQTPDPIDDASADLTQQVSTPSDEAIPLSTDTVLHSAVASLGARERETAEELSHLDPHLAGLYRLGYELAGRSSEAGVAYILAHIGRELSRGVVRVLAENDLQVSGADGDDVPENEENRRTIGNSLQLPPQHP